MRLKSATPEFRDLTRFVILLMIWQALISAGYGQRPADDATAIKPVSRISPAGLSSAASKALPGASDTSGRFKSKINPQGQVPDFRAVISVGRTLSALTVGAVTNHTLTITYNVFNLRGDPVEGALLTTTLQSGVSFQSASPTPDRSGQQLAFSLGSIPPLGVATAQLTVTLADSSTTNIDNGAIAFAYWKGRSVGATGLAAALRIAPINSGLLQSTVDANTTDPYIQSEAAVLGNDPTRIFQFVRDQVGYESYTGALRGARGTLWSMAGNSLDKASLLIALLRVSGIPAQYSSGTLSLALQKQLILSMFPAQTQLTGYISNGSALSDPSNDATLQAQAQTHYWVQFDNGTGTLVDADPDFANAQIGQTFTASQSTFAAVAANLHHTVTVKLNVELYQQGFFGPFASNSTPLTQTFTSAELVGHPLTLGHFVDTQTAGFVLSATTNSYKPYLVVGQDDANPFNDPIFTGQQYQEVLTNFPFASQVLTGVFLELDTTDPAGNTATTTHTILDRIGYAARKGLAIATINAGGTSQPAISEFDNVSINVQSSRLVPGILGVMQQRESFIAAQGAALPQIPADQTPDAGTTQQMTQFMTKRLLSATETMTSVFSLASQDVVDVISARSVVRAYFDSPRIVLATAAVAVSGQTTSLQMGMDLRKDDIRAIAFPGQSVNAMPLFQSIRGVDESALEDSTVSGLGLAANGTTASRTLDAIDVFNAAKAANIGLLSLGPQNIGQLQATNLSADAKARISDAVSAGNVVTVPTQMVNVGGTTTIGWYEVNPTTGVTIDTMENGNHQSIAEYVGVLAGHAIIGAFLLSIINSLKKALPPLLPPGYKGAVLCGLSIVAVGIDLFLASLIGGLELFAFGILATLGFLIDIAFFINDMVDFSKECLGLGGGGPGAEFVTSKTPEISQLSAKVPAGIAASPIGVNVGPPVHAHVQPGSSSTLLAGTAKPGTTPGNTVAIGSTHFNSSAAGGAVTGQVQAASVRATNQIAATWSSTAISSFQAGTLTASNATVKNSNGQMVGSGAVELSATAPVAASISGSVNYSVNGTGDLSFYGPAASALGASGNWTSYTAALTGSPSVQLSTNGLTLNGNPLAQDTYTISASSFSIGGLGQSTTPNFAGSASLTLTTSSVYVGPGSGTFTSGGTSVSPANGITLDGFNGTLIVTGNGTSDNVAINGNAAKVLAVSPSPGSFTTDENTPVTFATQLTTSLADQYSLSAEAPPGWTVSMDASGNVTATPAAGLQGGTFPVFVTATSVTDPNLVAQAAVLITLGATHPGVTLNVAADPTFTVPVNGAQLPSGFLATIQNTGPATDTFNVTFSGVPASFTVQDSGTGFTIPAGTIASDGIYLVPTGQLPAPGVQVSFTVTVTSATSPSVTASKLVSFTVPAVQALTLSLSPTALSTTPGTAVNSTLTLQSAGNIAVTGTLSAVADPNLSLSGLSPSVSLNAGQTSQQTLTLMPLANAPVGVPLAVNISAAFGTSQTATAALSVQLNAVQALAAVTAAGDAAALGRNDIATVLSGLSGAINTAISSCSPAAQQLVVDYVGNLIQLMNAPFLANFAADLTSAKNAIAAANCQTIGAALTQLSTVLAALAAVLSSPAAFPFNLSLIPNSATAQPGVGTVFLISLQNNSSSTNTYSLSLGSLPGGVTGTLSTASVTLGPGQSIPLSGANNNPSITITPSVSSAFQFSLNASINGVSGSAQTTFGTMTARATFLSVQDVTSTPGFTNAGGKVDVVTHIANVVNQNKTVQVALTIKDSGNNTVLTPLPQTLALSVLSLLTTVDFGLIDTTGLANGNYSLNVSVTDPVTSSVIPGGTGTGNLLIGSPVTATLTATPTTLAPGNGTVRSTLNVSLTAGGGGGGTPYSLLGSLMTASPAEDVALNGTTAYVCDQNEVSIVDVSNPANPVLLKTVLAGNLSNAAVLHCAIRPDPVNPAKNDLMMLVDAANTFTGNAPSFIAFDLTDPLNPTLIASTIVSKRFFRTPFYQGNTVFVPTGGVFLSGSFITGQFGDLVALDISNLNSPTVLGGLEVENNGSTFGGAFETYGPGAIQINSTTAYMLTSTMTGSNLTNGTGQVWVVNTSDPAHMSAGQMLNIPGTTQVASLQFQGNTAVVVGNTAGWANPLPSNGSSALGGNVVVAVLDITNPQNPQIVSSTTTQLVFGIGGGQTVLGTNLFLFAGIADTMGNQMVMTVDTTDPLHAVIKTFPVPGNFDNLVPVGNLLYAATSDHGLQIYSIPGTGGSLQYNATVQVPNTGKVIYNPNSFSIAPVVTPGGGFDTLTWTNPGVNSITWTSNVTGIQPADVLPVDLSGTVSFTVTAGSGTVNLAQVDVDSGQILGITPATFVVAPGQLAAYTVTVSNPTNASITYNLAVTGVLQTWVTLQSSVTVPAGGSVNVPLGLRSTLADIGLTNSPVNLGLGLPGFLGKYDFTVTATSAGVSGSVQGTMILSGTGSIGTPGPTNTIGVLTTLTPTQVTGGQGTAATYTVQLTNAGNVADTYALTIATPAGVTATFDQTTLQVPPGLSNFRQTQVHITAAQGTPVGAKNFTVTATSQANPQIQGPATGTLNLVSAGVGVAISPASTNPGATLHLTVTNRGSISDTFDLALGGPAAAVSSLAAGSVTLAPNQSQIVSIAVGAAPFASVGTLGLVAQATSRANTSVSAIAEANVVIPSAKGISAAFSPARTGLKAPGQVALLLQMQNTGTIDDSYIATIVSTSGPVTASLVDITGLPVKTTSVFILPGAAQGEFVVNANLTGLSDGTVTVKITSQTDPTITTTAVGVVGIGNSVPVAVAGKKRNVRTGRYVSLDGGQSYDPSENRLTYAWTVVSIPSGSSLVILNNGGLGSASTPQPFFLPDVDGVYTFQLIVNNGNANSAPSQVQITASTATVPPNADAGKAVNARRGSAVILNGTASSDPSQSGLALTYSWTVQSAPAGSALNGATVGGNTPMPSFTPDADGAFVIALKVSDTAGSSTDTVTITAFDPLVHPNATPNAVAGPNRRIVLNTPILVDGSASNDPDNAPHALSYQWRFVSSSLSDAVLMNASGAQTAFTPVAPGFYVLRLDVSDSVATSFDETTVMAAKFCDANADGLVNQADFDLMSALIGSAAQPSDPLDVNGDGLITNADILSCKGQAPPVAAPNLYATPAFLVFQYTKGGPLPPAQSLAISSDTPTQFTIPNPSFTWIKLNPQSAATPASVGVSIDPTLLAAGSYVGQLLPVANGFNSPAPIRIELTVFDAPQFIILPGSLTFTVQSGLTSPPTQTLSVGTSGKVADFAATVSGATWLSVNPSSGITPKPVVVTVTPAPNMAPGTYTGTITFSSSATASQSITVTLIVTAAPPTVDPSSIVNAASSIGGPVAPGEIIFLGGSGFAAAATNLAAPPNVAVATQLGDTQVFFDNSPAPLLLVEAGLIKAIVPYEVFGQTTTQMRVVYHGVSSQVVPLQVALTKPGIFTTTINGLGQVIAANADGTLNSVANPATRGTALTFYATGEGQTIPPGVDGAIAPNPNVAAGKSPPVPAQKVSITVGGKPAQFTYAGGAPTLPAGLMQVNVIIPNDAPLGLPVEVLLTVGNGTSQTGAQISIK
jgi:Transglutaminase-like superfamily/LVIVD repeat